MGILFHLQRTKKYFELQDDFDNDHHPSMLKISLLRTACSENNDCMLLMLRMRGVFNAFNLLKSSPQDYLPLDTW